MDQIAPIGLHDEFRSQLYHSKVLRGVQISHLLPGIAFTFLPPYPADLERAHLYTLPLNGLAWDVHSDNVEAGWWSDVATGARISRNLGEMLMLAVSELAEGDEGGRMQAMDDKLPHRPMLEVELADAKIRILDIAGSRQMDISGAAHDLIVVADMRPSDWFGISAALMRIVCEIARAMEGDRRKAPDSVLPCRPGLEVGLAAALLRIHWLAESLGFDLDGAVAEKREFNRNRFDHKIEARRAPGGKSY